MTDQEIISIPRIADLMVRANDDLKAGRWDSVETNGMMALDVVHLVWGPTPRSPIGQVQVWAIQALFVALDNERTDR